MMNKLKIKQIDLSKSAQTKSAGKTSADVLNFQINVARDINRVITEFNKLFPKIIVKPIATQKQQDNSEVKDLSEQVWKLALELEQIKKATLLNKAEIKSYRNIIGEQLDKLEQKLNKLEVNNG